MQNISPDNYWTPSIWHANFRIVRPKKSFKRIEMGLFLRGFLELWFGRKPILSTSKGGEIKKS